MFFIDKYFKTLKNFVQQQSHLKGSMVESYFMQKIMGSYHDVIGDWDGYVLWAWKCRNPTFGRVWGWHSHSRNGDLGVL